MEFFIKHFTKMKNKHKENPYICHGAVVVEGISFGWKGMIKTTYNGSRGMVKTLRERRRKSYLM